MFLLPEKEIKSWKNFRYLCKLNMLDLKNGTSTCLKLLLSIFFQLIVVVSQRFFLNFHSVKKIALERENIQSSFLFKIKKYKVIFLQLATQQLKFAFDWSNVTVPHTWMGFRSIMRAETNISFYVNARYFLKVKCGKCFSRFHSIITDVDWHFSTTTT